MKFQLFSGLSGRGQGCAILTEVSGLAGKTICIASVSSVLSTLHCMGVAIPKGPQIVVRNLQ